MRVAESVSKQAMDAGIRLTIQPLDMGTVRRLLTSRAFDIYMAEAGAHAVADPDQFIMSHRSGNLWKSGKPYPEWDALFEQWKSTTDIESRKQVSFRMQELYNKQPTSIPLYNPATMWAYRPSAYDQWQEQRGYGIVNKWSLLPAAAQGRRGGDAMTCYQRMHEVLLGVTRPEQPIDWDAILWDWMGVTDVHDRDHMLARMGVNPIDVYLFPGADLHGYTGLIISGRVDQELLYRHRDKIRGVPGRRQGGRLQWADLPPLAAWRRRHDSGQPGRSRRGWHADGGTAPDPRRRVDGRPRRQLRPRLHPRPRPAPRLMMALPDGKAVVYIDRASTNGTILAHAGINFMNYIVEPVGVREVIPNLIAWINAEAEARSLAGARS